MPTIFDFFLFLKRNFLFSVVEGSMNNTSFFVKTIFEIKMIERHQHIAVLNLPKKVNIY